MEDRFSIAQTVGAAIAVVVIYFVILYIGTPIIQWAFDLYGRLFVPERFGGGREVDNPGLLTLLFRVLLLSGISAWAAVAATFKIFEGAHARAVAVALGVSIVAWAGYLFFLMPVEFTFRAFMAALLVVLMAAPPLYFTYILWVEESWS
jgi:hypothetical protein